MFSVPKADIFCVKTKRQQQYFLCEGEASAAMFFCAKVKRQQQYFLCESETTAAIFSVRK